MNNSESAKKGFRTFILTLSISLMVFSAVYYVLTSYSPQESSVQGKDKEVAVVEAAVKEETPVVQGAKDERSVFADIVNKKPEARPQEVLAGATSEPAAPETSTSVPTTGYTEMTIGLILSLALFIGAMVYNLMNPRKIALSKFEKDALGKSK